LAPKKSAYFTGEPSDEEMEELESHTDQDSDDYEESSASSSLDEEVGSDFSEENVPPSHQQQGKKPAASNTVAHKGSTKTELWRPGVKTGLGPGTQVVIKKPKARDSGATAYTENTIHPNTMLFLTDLAANNDRQWLKSKLPFY